MPSKPSRPSTPARIPTTKKEGGELIEFPVQLLGPVDVDGEGSENGEENYQISPIQRNSLACRSELRLLAGAPGIPHGARNPNGQSRNQKCETETQAGGRRQLGHLLGDNDLKRVHRTEGGSHCRGAEAHRDSNHGRKPELTHQEQEHRHEGDQLLLHLHHYPAQAEGDPGNRDDQQSAAAHPLSQPPDYPAQGAGSLHYREGATNQENQRDDRGRIDDSARDCHYGLEGTHRMLRHPGVGAGEYDTPAGDGILPPLKLSCG